MNDQELLRYSRHILLEGIGIEGQEAFRRAHVLVVGLGGLGSAASLYLAAAGVGSLTLVDHDVVDLTNLQRQIAHASDRIGQAKVASAAHAIAALDPAVTVHQAITCVDGTWLDSQLSRVHLVVDCTDRFTIRQTINAACVHHRKPLVSGAALGFDGQVALYDVRLPEAPCYACVFPPESHVAETACATMGVFAPLVGMVGTAQAAYALQVLLGRSEALAGRLSMVDARTMRWDELRTGRDRACPVCAGRGSVR